MRRGARGGGRRGLVQALALVAVLAASTGASAQEAVDEPGMNSPGMVVGGIAMMAAGTAGIAFGGVLMVFAASSHVDCVQGPCPQPDHSGARAAGMTLALGGLGLIGGGVALTVVGAQDEEPGAPSARLQLTPTGAALTGAF